MTAIFEANIATKNNQVTSSMVNRFRKNGKLLYCRPLNGRGIVLEVVVKSGVCRDGGVNVQVVNLPTGWSNGYEVGKVIVVRLDELEIPQK